MQVQVIKAINGLEEGDILRYNEKTHKYELSKLEEDISDNGYSSKKTLHRYSKNIITENKDYFIFLDDKNDEVEVKETISIEREVTREEIEKFNQKYIDELKETNSRLIKRIDDLEYRLKSIYDYRTKYIPSYTYRLLNFL
jgi:hypothetical protein